MSSLVAMRFIIHGRVQGVFYRACAQKKAKRLLLTGFVRNLPDGSVEAIAVGSNEQLRAFHDWLKKGPPLAKVTEVASEEIAFCEYDGFRVI